MMMNMPFHTAIDGDFSPSPFAATRGTPPPSQAEMRKNEYRGVLMRLSTVKKRERCSSCESFSDRLFLTQCLVGEAAHSCLDP